MNDQVKVDNFYRVSSEDFKKIPGSPIAYWVRDAVKDSFSINPKFGSFFDIKAGISTGKNDEFILFWFEVSKREIYGFSSDLYKYTPHNKGGEFRKWYGNCEYILKYSKEHIEKMQKNPGFRHDGKEYFFREQVGWSKITSSKSSFRYYPNGYTFDSAGLALFSSNKTDLKNALIFLNSNVCSYFIQLLNPTLNVTPDIIKKLPYKRIVTDKYFDQLVNFAKRDWDTHENSMDFKKLPFVDIGFKCKSIIEQYNNWRLQEKQITAKIQMLEREINQLLIREYQLDNEIEEEIPLNEVSLIRNPLYRFNSKQSISEIEKTMFMENMKELISYSVGCIFGRYSLDKDGFILANAGDGIDEYLSQIPNPTFHPDRSGILPLTEQDDFPDDLPTQFYRFLRISFGEEHYQENLRFIEEAIGKPVRQYLLKDFFKDHVKRYKTRPIYWQITSPEGSFKALIYLHRYTKDTVGQVLNDYVRPFHKKLEMKMSQCQHIINSSASHNKEKIQAQKDLDRYRKQAQELAAWDADVLRPLALQRIELDLDDGVKVNYGKLGSILEPVKGLN